LRDNKIQGGGKLRKPSEKVLGGSPQKKKNNEHVPPGGRKKPDLKGERLKRGIRGEKSVGRKATEGRISLQSQSRKRSKGRGKKDGQRGKTYGGEN